MNNQPFFFLFFDCNNQIFWDFCDCTESDYNTF